MENRLICICGPTASGKTALSVALAQQLHTEIISADSMQLYREMDIGTAKPDMKERQGVPHHLFDVCEPGEAFSVARYVELADAAAQDILSRGMTPIVVGGTGLYMDALIECSVFSGDETDLTVRENAYLRGAMLGYTRRLMDETYEAIIDFAELREFEDRPFKQLSSGMKSRLAFSIASLVEPDILILDEVLSVGDGAFRKKSEAKMREIISGGATTILVSHSLPQVRELCDKVLWLHKGRQIAFGSNVDELCDRYQEFLDGKLKL